MNTTAVIPSGKWFPKRWKDIAGNTRVKQYWHDMIRGIRFEGKTSGYSAVIVGDPGSGKTASMELAMKSMGCLNLDPNTYDPCWQCAMCQDGYHIHGHAGWEEMAETFLDEESERKSLKFNYRMIDCPRLEVRELEEMIYNLKWTRGYIQIIGLDELHTLSRNRLDERLLKAMEQYPLNWIGLSALVEHQTGPRKIETMMLERFQDIVPTEKPDAAEYVEWCCDRCEELDLFVEDPETTIAALADVTDRVMRRTLHILGQAKNSRDKVVTKDMLKRRLL